jgi:hypothetical protein
MTQSQCPIFLFFVIFFQNYNADFRGWFRLKRKSRKTFDIIISTKSVFFQFRFWAVWAGCGPAATPTFGAPLFLFIEFACVCVCFVWNGWCFNNPIYTLKMKLGVGKCVVNGVDAWCVANTVRQLQGCNATAKQSQLMHNTTVYLFNLCLLVHLPDMFRQ